MKFNEIVKWKTSIGDFPCTRKFDSDNLPVDDSSKKHLRVWNSFKSTLSAAIICGLEIMPINKTTNILYIGTLDDDIETLDKQINPDKYIDEQSKKIK